MATLCTGLICIYGFVWLYFSELGHLGRNPQRIYAHVAGSYTSPAHPRAATSSRGGSNPCIQGRITPCTQLGGSLSFPLENSIRLSDSIVTTQLQGGFTQESDVSTRKRMKSSCSDPQQCPFISNIDHKTRVISPTCNMSKNPASCCKSCKKLQLRLGNGITSCFQTAFIWSLVDNADKVG